LKELILAKGLGYRIIDQLREKKMQEPWILYVHAMDLHELGDLPEEFNEPKYGVNQYDRMVSSVDVWIGNMLKQIDLEKTIIVLTGDHGSDEGAYTPSMKFVNYDKKPLDFDNKVYRLMPDTFWFKSDLSPKLRFIRNIIGKCLRIPQTILKQIRFMQINRQKIPLHQKRILKHAIADVEEIYDGLIRVPLIFSGCGIPKGILIEKQTRLIDVFPTIAELIGLPKRQDKIHGRSLVPYFHGKLLDELPARIESTPKWFAPVSKDQLGVRTSEYKYFRNRNNPTKDVCLYDLKNDPFEERNIASRNPTIVQKMETILSEVNTDNVSTNDFEDMDEETKGKIESELKKLGYI
jgi:arylsulfatase A-like enzyme